METCHPNCVIPSWSAGRLKALRNFFFFFWLSFSILKVLQSKHPCFSYTIKSPNSLTKPLIPYTKVNNDGLLFHRASIYSFGKYLLNAYSAPDTALDLRDAVVRKGRRCFYLKVSPCGPSPNKATIFINRGEMRSRLCHLTSPSPSDSIGRLL